MSKDDRLLGPTWWTAVIIVPVLIAAFAILYFFPTRTPQLWAWTIAPPMTAMVMGGGYLSGAYLFTRVLSDRRWHRVGVAFVSTTVFTSFLLAATVRHWDRFNHDHVSFWAWILLYAITPPLLPWLWARNRRTDPGVPDDDDVALGRPLRIAVAGTGAMMLGVAVLLWAAPGQLTPHWPWMLTPLTVRTIAAFIAFPAVTFLGVLFEDRWSCFRIPFQTATVGLLLVGVAAVVRRDDLQGPRSSVVLFTASLATMITVLLGLQLVLNRRARAAT